MNERPTIGNIAQLTTDKPSFDVPPNVQRRYANREAIAQGLIKVVRASHSPQCDFCTLQQGKACTCEREVLVGTVQQYSDFWLRRDLRRNLRAGSTIGRKDKQL